MLCSRVFVIRRVATDRAFRSDGIAILLSIDDSRSREYQGKEY